MRLIDLGRLRTEICIACADGVIEIEDCDDCMLQKLIDEQPTIEAEPVRHGRWETWGYVFRSIEWKRCSECGKPADISYNAMIEGHIEMATPEICPCCGAKMQGGAGDATN